MTKLHYHRHPAGLEWVILKKIPKILLGSIFIPFFMSIFVRLIPIAGSAAEIDKHLISIDIFSISLFFMVASAAFTMTIGCIIIVLMKGPVHIADAYELEKFSHPRLSDKSKKHLN